MTVIATYCSIEFLALMRTSNNTVTLLHCYNSSVGTVVPLHNNLAFPQEI